ncbi:hypothetical protein HMPREF9419_2228 [Prevotella nigrescens ATCC 33563]|nr:hypothetical protein HMPREF9419_2228 [Prevotella nigrescens ATCC 33563]
MWCQLQPNVGLGITALRCDLLKKLYLCGVNYNRKITQKQQALVVICLKSCIFVVSITTI